MSNRESSLQKIEQQLANLSGEDLYYVEHVLNALESSKDGTMHFFGKFLGIMEVDDKLVMELGPHNENTYGVKQGGALYTLADVAIGFYILKELPVEEKVYTAELKVNFIKKGQGNYLSAKTRMLHWGRNTVVADCSIVDSEDQLVAQALGTFFIVR